jgi:hypothetical protein
VIARGCARSCPPAGQRVRPSVGHRTATEPAPDRLDPRRLDRLDPGAETIEAQLALGSSLRARSAGRPREYRLPFSSSLVVVAR